MLPLASRFHHLSKVTRRQKRMRACVRYALVLFAATPTLLGAQGFGIYEQGTCAMGRAGAGVAAPCPDGSAMFFNPAGLAGLTGGHATIGVTLLDVRSGFTDDLFQQKTKLDDPLLAVPQVYISYAVFCLKKKNTFQNAFASMPSVAQNALNDAVIGDVMKPP